MKEPTKAQIKVVWEWCGLNEQPSGSWYTDSGEYVYMQIIPIDLGNLFKYAVPKVIDIIMAEQKCSSDVAYAILFKKWLQELELDIPQYSKTLFWALYSLIDPTP